MLTPSPFPGKLQESMTRISFSHNTSHDTLSVIRKVPDFTAAVMGEHPSPLAQQGLYVGVPAGHVWV